MFIETLFEGQELSEDFKNSVKTMFESAVADAVATKEVELIEAHQNEVNSLKEFAQAEKESLQEQAEQYGKYVAEQYQAQIDEQSQKYEEYVEQHIQENVVGKVDEFLNYVAEKWLEENKLAVESGIKTNMVEGFLTGLHSLFAEHYVEVPEGKTDVMESLNSKVQELQTKLDESIGENIKMKASIKETTKAEVIRDMSKNLSESQAERVATLAEGIEFNDEETFRHKVGVFVKTISESVDQKSNKDEGQHTGLVQSLTEQFENQPEMATLMEGLSRLAPRK